MEEVAQLRRLLGAQCGRMDRRAAMLGDSGADPAGHPLLLVDRTVYRIRGLELVASSGVID